MTTGGVGDNASIESTPTWVVSAVCFVLISVSILIEHGFHLIAKYLGRKRRKSLLHALNKIKSDLMLLGFISLSLTVLERQIASICIPRGVGQSFLPCKSLTGVMEEESKCLQQGKVALMSRVGVQQLQMLIFCLALSHVLCSFLTFSLGTVKTKRWENWEAETRSLEYQLSNDPERFQFIHQTSFGRRHLNFWSEHGLLRLPVSFLRQFFGSVYKIDYFTLRHGFIVAHFAQGSNFDFQKYLQRALEQDFEVVIGMRLWIWFFSLLFIFFNAYVFRNYAWLPFIPLLMLLVVGTKLQGIITKICLDSNVKSHVVKGTLLVEPGDHFFWFRRPQLLLHLIHFISFQNSFQLAFFIWSWYNFGLRSCFHQETEDIVINLAMGVLIPILCGYITLPLYALVTQVEKKHTKKIPQHYFSPLSKFNTRNANSRQQMGSSMHKSVFSHDVIEGLKRWRDKARRNLAPFRSPNLAQLSLDPSLESCPSFSTLDASHALDVDYLSDDGVESVRRLDEEIVSERQAEQRCSFEGFDLSSELTGSSPRRLLVDREYI